ncbi:MAG TPA: NAD(P)-dependent oxidoreductase [Candidatus Baltobacteraceae bacterium]|nr:NAD(P)-dependent oxidoreductase [Candidatus Baltobacteraceae bacterium]
MNSIGVVGLGKMGGAIARSLTAHGYPVSTWDRTTAPGPIEALVSAVDTVIVMLWGDEVAREVTLGRVIPAAHAKQLVIEMSTLSPAMYETLESAATAREIEFLAAPVLGSVGAVADGSITILPSGPQATYERARPLLESLGKTVIYTGSPRASGVLKLANNTIIGIVGETLAELLAFCDRGGVERTLAVESLTGAFGRIAGSKRQQLLDRDSEPRFALDALLKDLRLAREAAASLQVAMPTLDCVLPDFERASQSGLGSRDYIAIALEPQGVRQ